MRNRFRYVYSPVRQLRYGLFLLLAITSVGPVRAKEAEQLGDWTLTTWGIADGLPSNVVRGLAQTPDGYLWVATFGGLARFDGQHFEIFDAVSDPELGGSRFQRLLVDRAGTLWAGMVDGNVSTYREGQFRQARQPTGVGPINSIVEDREGTIWIGGPRGVGRYVDGAFQRVSEHSAHNLRVDANNDVWAGGKDGVFRIDNATVTRHFPALAGRVNYPLLPLPGQRVATCADGQIVRLPSGRPVATNVPKSSFLGGIVDRKGSCWWVSAAGLYRIGADDLADDLADEPLTLESRHQVLPGSYRVRVVLEDRDGQLWLGSEDHGLILLQRRCYRLLGHRDKIVPQEDGSYWAVMPSAAGVARFRGDRVVERLSLPQTHRITVARQGGIWVTYGSLDSPKLARYTAGQVESHPWPDGLKADFPIDEDHAGRLWQREAWDNRRTLAFEGGHLVETVPGLLIGETPGGALWFGLGPRGLGRFRDGQIDNVSVPDGQAPVEFRAVYEDHQQRVWVSTYGEGLWCLAGDRVSRLTTRQGLPHNMLGQIVADRQQRLWINSNRGLFVVSLDDLVRGTEDANHSVSCQMITDIEMSSVRIEQTAARGRMFFSTIEGAIQVDTRTMPAVPPPPATRIERIEPATTPGPLGRNVTLPTGARNVGFAFTAPYLLPLGGLRFRYQLEGIDSEWVDAGNRREAFYGQLPAGEYTFRVMARNAAGQLGPPDSVTIVLPHRFYETTWFHVLLAVIAGAIVLGLLGTEFRVIRAQRKALGAAQQMRRAEEETRGHRDQLARVARAASLGELATSIAHEVNQPLAAIVSNASAASRMMDAASPDEKEIRAALDDIVTGGNLAAGVIARVRALIAKQHVDVQRVDLNQVIHDVIELLAAEMKKRGVTIRLELTKGLPPAKGDPIELQQVMLNLLLNGAQAMDAVEPESRVLVVRSSVDDGELLVSVEDRGVGLDEETKEKIFEPFFTTRSSGVGMGLSINRSIIEFRGGQLWATQNPDCGATFHFTIPVFDEPAVEDESNQEQGA